MVEPKLLKDYNIKMKLLLKNILVSVFLFSLVATAYCAKKPVYIKEQSGKNKPTKLEFKNYLRKLSAKQIANAGFKNMLETAKARLLEPYRIYPIDHVKNLKYRGDDIYDILNKSNFWLYPIIVERNGIDRITSLLKIMVYRGKYEIESICCSETAKHLDTIVSIWSKSQGFKVEILKILQKSNIDFVIVENTNIKGTNIKPVIVALPSMYAKFKKLTAYDFKRSHNLLKSISRNELIKEGLNPYDIEGITPPKTQTSTQKATTQTKTKIKKLQKLDTSRDYQRTKYPPDTVSRPADSPPPTAPSASDTSNTMPMDQSILEEIVSAQ